MDEQGPHDVFGLGLSGGGEPRLGGGDGGVPLRDARLQPAHRLLLLRQRRPPLLQLRLMLHRTNYRLPMHPELNILDGAA